MITSANQNDLIPVTKWNDYHVWPPIGGLRHLIFHRKTNGFDKVIRRVGRRILIDEAAFRQWIEKLPDHRSSEVGFPSKCTTG